MIRSTYPVAFLRVSVNCEFWAADDELAEQLADELKNRFGVADVDVQLHVPTEHDASGSTAEIMLEEVNGMTEDADAADFRHSSGLCVQDRRLVATVFASQEFDCGGGLTYLTIDACEHLRGRYQQCRRPALV